jgi:hypothetical protein
MQFSNIQIRVNVNPHGWVSGKNVIYNRKNSDGSIDKVERVWHVYGGNIARGPASTYAIKTATERELPILTQFISQKDKTSRLKKHNTHLGGSLHSITRLQQPIVKAAPTKPAPPVTPTPAKPMPAPSPVKTTPQPAKPVAPALTPQQLTVTIQGLQAQVTKLNAEIVELKKQLAADKADKARLEAALIKAQNDNAKILAVLQILLKR